MSDVTRPGGDPPLLERSTFLETLDECATDVAAGRGRLVLLAGEAGIGKSALVRRFAQERSRRARVLWGACDALRTPRPLGPFVDVALTTGGRLEAVVRRGDKPHAVFAALLEEVAAARPTIVVLEDLHWADEATLDVLALMGGRAEASQALVVATYRDDELAPAHPLRLIVGEIGGARGVRRLRLPALSVEAVQDLAAAHTVDGDELHRRTEGNPFFVSEVLAAEGSGIPETVLDAVLARAGRLSAEARGLLETVAVLPPRAEMWLLDALPGASVDHLDECLSSGMLSQERDAVTFRHELQRLSIENSMSPGRRVALHRDALRALGDPPDGDADLARLAHHAEAAGDREAVLTFAPAAAARASSLGAHREAGAQYARALRFGDRLPSTERADLLERRSFECFVTDQLDDAIEALELAVACHREVGDVLAEGRSLRKRSELMWCPGRIGPAEEAGEQAVAVLETLPAGRELGLAYASVAANHMHAEDVDGTRLWGDRALVLGERLGDAGILAHALCNIGAVEFMDGAPGGIEKLERSLELAEEAGIDEEIAITLVNLCRVGLRRRCYALADRHLDRGLQHCIERDLGLWTPYFIAHRARMRLDRGRWPEAAADAALVLQDPGRSPLPRILANAVLGTVRARRGDPEPWAPLDEALPYAEMSGHISWIAPIAAARAEAAWLEGRHGLVRDVTQSALELACDRRASWEIGELAFWRRRAGVDERIPAGCAEPYALQLAGNWARAAELWTELGCPYETALARTDADDPDVLRSSLAELHRLDARPMAAIVARSLRARGIRDLPRGPRPSTRRNLASLTSRELQVLGLVAEGLTNAAIAERLFVSPKTVDHHVSAILRKLDVHSRGHAVTTAMRLGLSDEPQTM